MAPTGHPLFVPGQQPRLFSETAASNIFKKEEKETHARFDAYLRWKNAAINEISMSLVAGKASFEVFKRNFIAFLQLEF